MSPERSHAVSALGKAPVGEIVFVERHRDVARRHRRRIGAADRIVGQAAAAGRSARPSPPDQTSLTIVIKEKS